MDIITLIAEHEGFKGFPYKDSKGYWTIGIGTKLPITVEESKLLLNYRLNKITDELVKNKPYFNTLPNEVRLVLLDMAYNLGVPKLMQFKKMFKAIENKDWRLMIEEIKDSKYYYDVTHRAENNIRIIKSMIG